MPTLCWWITAWSAHRSECRRRRPPRCAPSNSTPRWPRPTLRSALIRSLYDWEWQEARGLYARAIELNPGYATARHWLGIDWFALTGRFAEARAEIDIALQLDPLSSIIREGKMFIRFLEHRYDEAAQGYCELIADDPTFYKGYTSLGRVYAQQGKFLDAIRMLEKGRSLAGDVPNILGAMGQVYALGGEPDRAREILGQLEQREKSSWVPSTVLAIVHLGLGEHDRALDYLERGCRQHELPMTALKVHPVYDPLARHTAIPGGASPAAHGLNDC